MIGLQNGSRDASLNEKTPYNNTKDVDSSQDGVSLDTDAAIGLQQEKAITVGKAFWYYRKAVCWSVLICKLRTM